MKNIQKLDLLLALYISAIVSAFNVTGTNKQLITIAYIVLSHSLAMQYNKF